MEQKSHIQASQDPAQLTSVVIVGGGTAGWMAAATLARNFGPNLNIVLIESDEIGTVGVGEATIPAIKNFNEMLGLDEGQFIRRTQGTYKLGIEFVNWGRIGDRYMHPFGTHGFESSLGNLHQLYLMLRAKKRLDQSALMSHYCLGEQAAYAGRMAQTSADPKSSLACFFSAYHFDASLYARFLRDYSEQLGVERVQGRIVGSTLEGSSGHLKSVHLADGRELFADFFIDCSGFRGLLIEEKLKTGYEDWSHWLPMDRAVAVPCSRTEPVLPYTRATAHSAGWQWRIPLQHRTGNGHVFSSEFMEESEATELLMRNLDGKALADPKLLRFKTGRRRQAWNRNVLSLGLAAGFIEPLESTSIHLIQSGLMKLLEHFPDKTFNQANIDTYNRRIAEEYVWLRNFIICHYHVTQREDSDFWNYVRTMSVPDEVSYRIDLFDDRGLFTHPPHEWFSHTSWLVMLLGQNVWPRSYNTLFAGEDIDRVDKHFKWIRTQIAHIIPQLPPHDEFLQKHGMLAEPVYKI